MIEEEKQRERRDSRREGSQKLKGKRISGRNVCST